MGSWYLGNHIYQERWLSVSSIIAWGRKYAYWKTRTIIFIQSINGSAWDAVENEWTPLTQKVEDAMTKLTKEVINPRSECDDAEEKSGRANAKALNIIFAINDEEQFNLISICK